MISTTSRPYPIPPTSDPVATVPPDAQAVSGVGSPPPRAFSERTIRLVSRFLAHPLTQASYRVALVGVCVVGWAFFFAVAVLP